MSSVPVHDLQVFHEIDSDDGQWSDHGDNRWGPELRAKGGGRYSTLHMQRSTVHGNSNAIIGIVEAKNTGDTPADGYHGLGLHVSALKRVGNELREIWNNDLLTAGNIDHWLTDLEDRWSRGSVIVQIPDEHNPDFIDSHWVYKTTTGVGKVRIDGIGIYDHMARVYKKSVTDRRYTGFTIKTLYDFFLPGFDVTGFGSRLIDSNVAKISKGQQVDVTFDALIDEMYGTSDDSASIPAAAVMYPALKLLSADGTSEWELFVTVYGYRSREAGQQTVELEQNIAVSSTKSFIANKAYFQYELYLVMARGSSTQLKAPFVVDISTFDFVMTLNDQKETGSD